MQRDGITNTFLVAIGLCLLCSLLVSAAAIQLKPQQDKNAELYRKRNVLEVAGLDRKTIESMGGVEKVFAERVTDLMVNLDTGKEDAAGLARLLRGESGGSDSAKSGNTGGSDAGVIARFNPIKAAKNAKNKAQNPALATPFKSSADDLAGLGAGRENFTNVYSYRESKEKTPVWIFPIRGRGLWSTMYGFLALQADLKTVAGITFFEHGETPGLGGEIENPNWKARWPGKNVFDDVGEVELRVIKGFAMPGSDHDIDGLSGATITSNGVSNTVKFWMGPRGFGPFLKQQQAVASGANPAQSVPAAESAN